MKIFLIDSMAYIFRSFYAVRGMTSKDGTPTNALLGFVRAFEKIIRDFDPDHIAAVFDPGGGCFRNEMYPEYKANRSECPEDLKPQFDLVKEYLKLRGIRCIQKTNFEADDVIGTLATMAATSGGEAVICSGDKDMLQLINDKVTVCQTHKDNLIIDNNGVFDVMGVKPEQVIDYLAIMGDSADNVPGLPGIGAKGAAKLLGQLGTLDNILANPDQVSGKRAITAVTEHADLGRMSRDLVTIKCDVEFDDQLEDFAPVKADWEGLANFYEKYSMNALLRDLDKIKAMSTMEKKPNLADLVAKQTPCKISLRCTSLEAHKNEIVNLTVEAGHYTYDLLENEEQKAEEILAAHRSFFANTEVTFDGEVFAYKPGKIFSKKRPDLSFDFLVAAWLTDADLLWRNLEDYYNALFGDFRDDFDNAHFNTVLAKTVTEYQKSAVKYHLVDSVDQFVKIREKAFKAKEICVDSETTSLNEIEAEIVGVGFAFKAKEAFYIPFNSPTIDRDQAFSFVKELLENTDLSFYGQNIKYDDKVFKSNGINIANISFDTLLASYLCNPGRRTHALDNQTLHYLNYRKIETASLIGKGKKQISMADVPLADIAVYCCEDVDTCLQLRKLYKKELKDRKQDKLLTEMELPLMSILANMELNGVIADPEVLLPMSEDFAQRIEESSARILEMAGEEFNIASTQQLGKILFEKLGLPSGKKTKSGYSTDASVLESLAHEHEIAREILNFRQLSKLKSTYIDALPAEIQEKTGRIHAHFSQTIAATGRLSSANPNLQNIPVRSEAGKKIRSAFKAAPGHSFLACDYSQIELRIMAHICGDKALLEAFNKGFDIHTYTASLVFGIPMEEVTKEQRYQSKAVNFGIIYGQGPYGLAKEIGVSPDEAKKFIKEYFMRYPGVQTFMSKAVEDAKAKGYSETTFGRRRYLPEINSSNGRLRAFAERMSVNSPIQGTAADVIKKAMIDIDKELSKRGLQSKLILQIHDELIYEVPDAELEDMKKLVPKKMAAVGKFSVPLAVDLAVAADWSQCD